MGIGALQQCEGLSGYVSNGSWCKMPRTGHLQWNTVEVWQVPPTGKSAAIPIFWDVPRANIHAVEDIGAVVDWLLERYDFQSDAKSNLAVLHNRNDMTNLFRASNWVSSSNDSIVSRRVTTCAGMTAHTVLLAQTKVGFLTGGRKKSFRLLSEDEQMGPSPFLSS